MESAGGSRCFRYTSPCGACLRDCSSTSPHERRRNRKGTLARHAPSPGAPVTTHPRLYGAAQHLTYWQGVWPENLLSIPNPLCLYPRLRSTRVPSASQHFPTHFPPPNFCTLGCPTTYLPSAADLSRPPSRDAPTPAPLACPPALIERTGGWARGRLGHEQEVGPEHRHQGRRKRRPGQRRRHRGCPGGPGGFPFRPALDSRHGGEKRAAHYPATRTCRCAAVKTVHRLRGPRRSDGHFRPHCHGRRPPQTCCSSRLRRRKLARCSGGG